MTLSILLCPMLGATYASSFTAVAASFGRSLIYVDAVDSTGVPHRMLVDSGSPRSFIWGRTFGRASKVALSLVAKDQKIHLSAAVLPPMASKDHAGVIGLDFLQRYQLAIDYEEGLLWIRKPPKNSDRSGLISFLRKRVSGPAPLREVPLRRIEGGYYGIDLTLNGLACNAVLDTGSQGVSLITDRGEGWKLDPVGTKSISIHSGPTTAKDYLAQTVTLGGFVLRAQPVTCVPPAAITPEPWLVDSVVSSSIFPSRTTIIDFPNRRVYFAPSKRAAHSAFLRHLLPLPVRGQGARFSLNAYFVNLPPVVSFQSPPTDGKKVLSSIPVGRPDGTTVEKPLMHGAVLSKISGRPIAQLLRQYELAQSGSLSAYGEVLEAYRLQVRDPECTIILSGHEVSYRATP